MTGRWHQGELRSVSAQGYHRVWGLMSQIIILLHHHGCCFFPGEGSGISHWSLEESSNALQAFHCLRRRLQRGDWATADSFKHDVLLEADGHSERRIMITYVVSDQKFHSRAEQNMQTLPRFGMYWCRFVLMRMCWVWKWSKNLDKCPVTSESDVLITPPDCWSDIYLSNYSGLIVPVVRIWGISTVGARCWR